MAPNPPHRQHPATRSTPAQVPEFLSALAARARSGDDVLLDMARPLAAPPPGRPLRHSAVLLLITGQTLEDSQVVLEERGHRLRSQPGQFALPGGGADPEDLDDVHTALREAEEEVGLDPAEVSVLGSFAPILMPWQSQRVTPVLGWAPSRPRLGEPDPVEVERVVWAPLSGPDSLTDPRRRGTTRYQDRPMGPVFDLPGDVFVWGFTAMLLERVLVAMGLPGVPADAPPREIPAARRR
jgi:8-oxo-dGTP pyrophosphatase MutT (NUDIX family)